MFSHLDHVVAIRVRSGAELPFLRVFFRIYPLTTAYEPA